MITKTDCCCQTLDILISHVKTLEDLTLIESTIEDYQDTFKVNLIEYKRRVKEMKENYGYGWGV